MRVMVMVAAGALALGVAGASAQPRPQVPPPAAPPPAPQSAPATPESDPLGRDTPRGSVLHFLEAARGGNYVLAREYLDTRVAAATAETLAQQLFVVLDARLPARLSQISDKPEGSRSNPLTPDLETIGTIQSAAGPVSIVLDRVPRGSQVSIWVFSRRTLEAVPRLYEEVTASPARRVWPRFLTENRFVGLSLLEWLVLLLGIPLFFVATALLNRVLVALVRPVWRRFSTDRDRKITNVLPLPARLLLLTVAGRLMLTAFPLSLMMRQFWSAAAGVVAIASIVWLLIILNGEVEGAIRRRVWRDSTAVAALLRVIRRIVDVLLIVGGIAAVLRYFGVESTPALAGLGVGGIAVALAAQKTLENVIAGASLIFDQAVRVGDSLKLGETVGTVDHIGLRSTRIRTLDRTMVSIPNSQIANATVETISARDKYWFHPEVKLRYETTPAQLQSVLGGIRRLLDEHPSVEPDGRVRFIRIGTFSYDLEVFAYVYARDWNEFLRIQEELLLGVTAVVERSGTSLATPSTRPAELEAAAR